MRGKHLQFLPAQIKTRITPAYAGKTDRSPRNPVEPPDHPRVCGENFIGLSHNLAVCGSPPRMRGKLHTKFFALVTIRITPAYAGKTCYSLGCVCTNEDHPRVCGENKVEE